MTRRHFIRACVLGLALGRGAGPLIAASGWQEGATLPALDGFGLEGSIPALKGKVVYLDFWASWCAPCKASFPILENWQRQFGGKGFTVLAVSVDESAADMQRFLAKRGTSFTVVRDAGHKLATAADIASMPASFLIDGKGVIRLVHSGFRAQDEPVLTSRITSLLGRS